MTATHAVALSQGPLDYEHLLAEYRQGLVERLRGFGTQQPDLALWVPDDDPLTSLRNMLDAAATAGKDELWVRLGPATAQHLDLGLLQQTAGRFGDAAVEVVGSHVELRVRTLRTCAPTPAPRRPAEPRRVAANEAPRPAERRPPVDVFPSALGPTYTESLAKRVPAIAHQRIPAKPSGHRRAVAHAGGVSLALVVDHTGMVTSAGFAGAPHAEATALLELLCRGCEQRPLVEVRDHCVLRLEFDLRPHRDARPCPGVVTPEAADPAFAVLQRLVHAAAGQLLPDASARNTYDPSPDQAWLNLEPLAREHVVRSVLEEVALERGLPRDAVGLLEVQHDVRVVVGLSDAVVHDQAPATLVALERAIKDNIDPRLELFVAQFRDRNKRRRLAIAESPQ